MKNSSLFQMFILIFLGLCLAGAVLIFAGVLPGFKTQEVGVAGTVIWWGNIPTDRISLLLSSLNETGKGQFKVQYVYKDPNTIGADLLEALASDRAPDLVLLPQDLIFRHRDKLYPLPFSSLAKRQYTDTFVDGASIFEGAEGYLALPMAVDPLVLYYNKDLYRDASLLNAPRNWEEFLLQQRPLTIFDNLNRLQQSAVSFGASNNVRNLKDIFALLSMQAGQKPVTFDGNKLSANLLNSSGTLSASQMALDFYNQFSDPQRPTYTWSRSLPLDRDYFLAGRLANYFGFSSELDYLLAKNPHLNFDLAPAPRLDKGSNLTLGQFYGLAVLRRTSKAGPAFNLMFALALGDKQFRLDELLRMAPVRREFVALNDPDPRRSVIVSEALACSAWPDPRTEETTNIFRKMVDDSSAGRTSVPEALKIANDELKVLLGQ